MTGADAGRPTRPEPGSQVVWPSRALVVGLRVAGRAMAGTLLRHRVEVLALDDAGGPEVRAAAADLGIRLLEAPTPAASREAAQWADWVVPSPGVPLSHPALLDVEPERVVGELDLGAALARAPIVGITGTNGKTTVTTLVVAALRAAGRVALPAGNVGTPLVDAAVDPTAEFLVVEASSFQLATARHFRAQVACWLNLAPDHLDWHGSLDAYVAAKTRLLEGQRPGDLAVLAEEDPIVRAAARATPARVVTFGLERGDYREESGWLVGPSGRLAEVGALARRLPLDVKNALAVFAIADGLGVSPERTAEALVGFSGLPHRVALVARHRGVAFYDDSKATTPDAVLAALAGFPSAVLIAGGRNKGLDLSVLRAAADRLRAVVAYGEAAAEIAAAFVGVRRPAPGPAHAGESPSPLEVVEAESMEEAVALATVRAEPGDAVLLSPACASFDRYRSYAERGDAFQRAVAALVAAESAGASASRSAGSLPGGSLPGGPALGGDTSDGTPSGVSGGEREVSA